MRAKTLAEALERFDRGRLVVHITEMPIKCPVAPLEFTFLAEAWLREKGLRDRVELVYVTPLDGAFTKPVASAHLGGMLDGGRLDGGPRPDDAGPPRDAESCEADDPPDDEEVGQAVAELLGLGRTFAAAIGSNRLAERNGT